jgi:threonine 3-dehydrogenase
MRILLTGAGGQVGTDLIPLLLSQGHEVVGFDLAPPAEDAAASSGRKATWIRGDVTVPEEVSSAVQASRAESIWHLAAILSATGEKIPFRAWRVNMDGTRNVLEAARLFGAKQVIFTSTIAAFGPGLDDPVGNDVSMRPTTMYGLTKVAGELLGEWYAKKFGLDFRGVRFPGLISLVEPGGGTSDYVNWMYFDGVRKGAYEAFVTAETRIPLMYMPDALRALVELAAAPRAKLSRAIYNIAAMSPRADEIAAAVRRRVPGVKITFKSDPVRQAIVDSWPRSLDDAVARKDWGWAPRYDLDAMSDELVAAVQGEAPTPKAPTPAKGAAKKPASKRTAGAAPAAGKRPASTRR